MKALNQKIMVLERRTRNGHIYPKNTFGDFVGMEVPIVRFENGVLSDPLGCARLSEIDGNDVKCDLIIYDESLRLQVEHGVLVPVSSGSGERTADGTILNFKWNSVILTNNPA